jgi:hypothetical protein
MSDNLDQWALVLTVLVAVVAAEHLIAHCQHSKMQLLPTS